MIEFLAGVFVGAILGAVLVGLMAMQQKDQDDVHPRD